MPLPASIEAAAARADQLMQRQGTPAQPAPTEGQPQQPVTPAPVAAPVAPAAPVEPPPTPAFEAGWEKRFRVLQGKYDAEVPRLHGELRELKTQLQAALEQVNAIRSQAPAVPDLSVLTAEEREQYGDDFINVVAKVAKANAPAAPAQPAVDPNVNERLHRIETVVAETREEEFFRKLGSKASQWESLNTDRGFLGWLGEVDPLSGRTRQQLFDDAYQRLDVDRVANFFNTFGGNQSNVDRTTQIPTLESQVTPRPSNAAPAAPQGKQIYTAQSIAKFYDDIRRGVYRGQEAEMARIEQDIYAAQHEGRVR